METMEKYGTLEITVMWLDPGSTITRAVQKAPVRIRSICPERGKISVCMTSDVASGLVEQFLGGLADEVSFQNVATADQRDVVDTLVDNERARAYSRHRDFNTPHEGWSVIREEVLEARAEYANIETALDVLDSEVRMDNSAEEQRETAKQIAAAARRGIDELIQVAAMADKYAHACTLRVNKFAALPVAARR